MNILTFDIEEWAIAKDRGYGTAEKYACYDSCLNKILDVLDNNKIKATFFCTGAMADEFPYVVKLINSRGHEVGCHSYKHTWMNKLSEAEVREDIHMAITALEQCIGEKVCSYRAPAFSICGNNKWVFEILVENGITHDASVFPAVRDFGGFPEMSLNIPALIQINGLYIKEFPVCVTNLCGKRLAYSGGGYFRFFPLWFIKRKMKNREYNMSYFHIGDFISEQKGLMARKEYEDYFKEPGVLAQRYLRYLKSNIGIRNAFPKMTSLIRSIGFINIAQADQVMNWNQEPITQI